MCGGPGSGGDRRETGHFLLWRLLRLLSEQVLHEAFGGRRDNASIPPELDDLQLAAVYELVDLSASKLELAFGVLNGVE
jgi:hypothetical protein